MKEENQLLWIAGTMKSGTTWLRNQLLSLQPNLTTFRIKELAFFWEAELQRDLQLEISDASGHLSLVRKYKMHQEATQQIKKMRWNQFQQHYRWWERWAINENVSLTDRGMRYYKQISGVGTEKDILLDASVENAILSPSTIQWVKNRFPDFKVVIMLRDPIERMLSQANLMFGKNEDHSMWFADVDTFLSSYNAQNEYDEIIYNFSSVLDEDQLMFRFHEEIEDNPQQLVNDIAGFCNWNINTNISVKEKYHRKYGIQFTDNQIEMLKKLYKHQIEFCMEYFPESAYPKMWYEKYYSKIPAKV